MYEKEIDKLVKLCGRENDKDLEAIKKSMEMGLKVGVANGLAVAEQIELCEEVEK